MPQIDATYFDRDLLLVGVNDATISASHDDAIEIYEPEYLERLLGPSLYAAYLSAIENPSSAEFSSEFSEDFDLGDIEQRFYWLINGYSYTLNGRKYNWLGLKNDRKQSPIACYVYYKYRENTNTHTTSISEVKGKSENATAVSADQKMVNAWNKMVHMNRELWLLLTNLRDSYNSVYYTEMIIAESDPELFATINTFGI